MYFYYILLKVVDIHREAIIIKVKSHENTNKWLNSLAIGLMRGREHVEYTEPMLLSCALCLQGLPEHDMELKKKYGKIVGYVLCMLDILTLIR